MFFIIGDQRRCRLDWAFEQTSQNLPWYCPLKLKTAWKFKRLSSCACFVKSFVFDKVPEITLKLTTIGHRRKVIAYCWADGKLLFFFSRLLLKWGRLQLSKYDNGTYIKHLHKMKLHDSIFDGRNSVITVKPCLPWVTSTFDQLCRDGS